MSATSLRIASTGCNARPIARDAAMATTTKSSGHPMARLHAIAESVSSVRSSDAAVYTVTGPVAVVAPSATTTKRL